MILDPSGVYRYSLKNGMSGTDVAALQLNLDGLVVDGAFGSATTQAVKDFQTLRGLKRDGIAGPKTQEAIIIYRSNATARSHGLPSGLLKSIAFNESGFAIGAAGAHGQDNGYDVGAYMISSGTEPGTQQFYTDSYTVATAANLTAAAAKARFDNTTSSPVPSQYLTDLAGGDVLKFRWQMAVLDHNWPVAAQNIPTLGHIFHDPARDDETQDWIVAASSGTLHTSREWVTAYIDKATVYVQW